MWDVQSVFTPTPFSGTGMTGGSVGGEAWWAKLGQPPSCLPSYFLPGSLRFPTDAKETGRLGKDLSTEQLLEQSKAVAQGGRSCLPSWL